MDDMATLRLLALRHNPAQTVRSAKIASSSHQKSVYEVNSEYRVADSFCAPPQLQNSRAKGGLPDVALLDFLHRGRWIDRPRVAGHCARCWRWPPPDRRLALCWQKLFGIS